MKTIKLGQLWEESKVVSENPNSEKRIKVKLNVQGVEKRPDKNDQKGATKYFIRKVGQFIYGKQNLHKGAFGVIPKELDNFESSSDIPAFDIIEEGKIKKGKELPAISDDEIPYELPKGWVWCRLGNLVSILGDGIHGTPNYTNNGECFFVNGNNLDNGKITIKENTKRVSEEECEKYKKKLNDRTILVSINGTLGNVAFYNNEKIMLGKSACYFNLLNDINKDYIKLIIETNYFLDYCFRNATGSTIKNVSLNSMRLFPIPLPPLPEQRQIVEKVDVLMSFCDELELRVKENKVNSEGLMSGVLREAFSEGFENE